MKQPGPQGQGSCVLRARPGNRFLNDGTEPRRFSLQRESQRCCCFGSGWRLSNILVNECVVQVLVQVLPDRPFQPQGELPVLSGDDRLSL